MWKNVGTLDRCIRILVGLLMAGLAVYFKVIFGVIAIYPLFTGIIAWDPIYKILGIDTDLWN